MEDNEIPNYPTCPLNEAVCCSPENRNCGECGWNPVVDRHRLIRICNAMGIEVPEKTTEGS